MTYNDINDEYEYVEKNAVISLEKTASGKFVFKIKLPFRVEDDENAVLERINRIYKKMEETYKNE